MRLVPLLLAGCAFAQQPPFTTRQVLSSPFPSSLISSPEGKVAWVSNVRGVRNVMVAEPPEYRARQVTSYTADDGQEISDLRWTAGARALVYDRGGSAN